MPPQLGQAASSTTPSPPTLPTPQLPSSHLVHLLSWPLLVTYLFPSAASHIVLPFSFPPLDAENPPRWGLWLESWYRSFCPLLWTWLGEDELQDLEAILDQSDRRDALQEELEGLTLRRAGEGAGGGSSDSERVQKEIDELFLWERAIQTRRYQRFTAVFGLYIARRKYLEFHQALPEQNPSLSPEQQQRRRDEALARAEAGDPALFSPFAAGSVWPVLAPHPSTPCTCHICPRTLPLLRSICLPTLPDTPKSRELSVQLFGREEGPGDANPARWAGYEARRGVVGRAKEWVGAALFGRETGRR